MKLAKRLSSSIIWLIPLLYLSLLACSPAKEEAAAIVNGETISKEDLQLSLDNTLNQYKAMGIELDSTHIDTLRNKILDSMVTGELLYQESQKAGYKVSEEEVSKEIESMIKRYPSEEMYHKSLAEQGLSEEKVGEQITRNLTIRKFVDEEISKGILISDEEKAEYYESHKDKYAHDEQIAAKHIVLQANENDPPESLETKKALLKSLRERIEAGESFSTLASEYSQGPTSSKGGDLGYFSRGRMVKAFEDAAFALKTGEMSDVIQTQYGFHLIQVYDRRPAGQSSFEEVEKTIEEMLKRPKINSEIDKLVKELKEKATIEILL